MKTYIFSFIFFLFIIEIMLRFSGIYETYNEKSNNQYISKYRKNSETWFHTWTENETIQYQQKEFNYTFTTNEFGHREKYLPHFNESNSNLVICIGDSFTEGDGAPSDSTWVKRLEYLVDKENESNFTFYNAGVCGSDIFYNYKILKEKLIDLKPKIIIEALNTSDIYDVIYRGGEERFNMDGSTSYKVGPKWEFFYKNIHFFRAIINSFTNYNTELINNLKFDEQKEEAIKLIKKQIEKTSLLCEENNIKYFLVIHPVPVEILNKKRMNEFSDFTKLGYYIMDIQDDFYIYFLSKNIEEYSWEINGHYNSKGYFLMGDLIYDKLNQLKIFKVPEKKLLKN